MSKPKPKPKVQTLTTRRTVNLPFSVVLKDFEVAKLAYLDNLEQDCINDPESLAMTHQMLVYAEPVWQLLLADEPLFQRFVLGHLLEDEQILTGAVLETARRIDEAHVRFFEANATDLFWDRFEFIRDMITSEKPNLDVHIGGTDQ